MGFFSHFLDDIGNIGSHNSSYKIRFVKTFNLLADFSYGDSKFSKETDKHRIYASYLETQEIASLFSNPYKERVKLYTSVGVQETTIAISLIALRISIKNCANIGDKFSKANWLNNIYTAELLLTRGEPVFEKKFLS